MEIVSAQPIAHPATEADEAALLARLREGDRRAAEQLVECSYTAVFASLVRMCGGDRELAADLTQDTYRKAWEAIGEFDGRARFTTWLYRIAYTTFLNHVRRPARVMPLPENAPEPADPAPRADEIVRSRQEYLRLRQAVMTLADDLRFTVTAHFWGELPVREIAELEHVTTVAIRKRLERAYRQLESQLQKDSR